MATVFLSYDHDDVERAAPIASALEKAGHSVWWDRHIQGGAQYNDEIEAAVEAANAVVVLWSERSVRSTWVRDEAAEGRDQNKLVPVLLDAVKPPMGFRQFQTIDLSRSSRGPSGSSLQQILDSIEKVRGAPRPSPPPLVAQPYKGFGPISRRTGAVAAVLALLGLAGFFAWTWRSEPALAVVAVTASDAQPRSQALSHDLVVKLGTLANIGSSKWQLADPQSARSDPDLVFRVAESESSGQSLATLVLLDGKRNSVLWSREFAQQKGTVADLRLQVTLTAGRALGCALDAREAEDLTPDLFKRFLVGCSEADEISNNEPDKTVAVMRAIIAERPSFAPAWAQLLIAQANVVGFATSVNGDAAGARQKLSQDIANARRIVPDLPEIRVAEVDLLSPFDYAGALEKTAQAKALATDKAIIWASRSQLLQRVGRMVEAIDSARRAAELDPLSPAVTTHFIMTLAHAGRFDLAREELRQAERRWVGTGALRDAQWGFHLRYGDPRVARSFWPLPENEPFYRARENPTPANIDALVAFLNSGTDPNLAAAQAFGEFHQTDEVFRLLNRLEPADVALGSYILFRPTLADVRRDPRFMVVAKRIGLISYWQKSGTWPDYCYDPKLPYDCQKEAAKLAA